MKTAITLFTILIFLNSPVQTQQHRAAKPVAKPQTVKPQAAKPAGNFTVTQLDTAKLTALLASPKANKKPLLINFWATWCAPCREEFPDLLATNAKYSARGLNFVTVSADETDLLNTDVPKVLRELKATQLPAYLLPPDLSEQAIALIDGTWSGQLPATFLFNKEGKLVFSHKGRVVPAELNAAIEKLIGDE